MYKGAIIVTVILLAVYILPSDQATAQESQVIHYQGILTGPDGGPLPTDTYDIDFSIWDQEAGGVEPIWSETQVVEVTEGLFDVFLGNVNALSADVFTPEEGDGELRYLEIQVAGDDPMTPRTQIAKTPNSFVSSRVLGDIQTGIGSFKMMEPGADMPAFEMIAEEGSNHLNVNMTIPPDPYVPAAGLEMISDDLSSRFKINWTIPPDDIKPGIVMEADGTNTATFKMIDPGDDEIHPAIEMTTTPDGSAFNINRYDPGDMISYDAISIDVDGLNSVTNFRLIEPGNDERPGFEMTADGSANTASFRMIEPADDEKSLIEMWGGADGNASIYMFNPQPEPPAKLIEINSLPLSGASFKMSIPPDPITPAIEMRADAGANQSNIRLSYPPDPYAPVIDMTTDASSHTGSIKMSIPPDDQYPAIEIAVDQDNNKRLIKLAVPPDDIVPAMEMVTGIDENSFRIASPVLGGHRDEITDPKFEVKVDSDGGSMDIYDEYGKYMGLEPSPFAPGGLLYLMDPGTGDTTVAIASNGHIAARQATFGPSLNYGVSNLITGYGHIVNSSYDFVAGYNTRVDHDDCFLWADYSLDSPLSTSATNQFLVRSTGGVKFYTDGQMVSGVELLPGASSWSSISGIDAMRDVRDVASEQILEKISQLPLKRYRYKSQDESIEHIGPLAKDFNELFGNKGEDSYISMSDESGVALAGVKALLERIEQLEARIAELEAERR